MDSPKPKDFSDFQVIQNKITFCVKIHKLVFHEVNQKVNEVQQIHEHKWGLVAKNKTD